jgi:hypothetical protein
MDILLGSLFWGGLLALTLLWIARNGLTGKGRYPPPRMPPGRQQPGSRDTTAWSGTTQPGRTHPADRDRRLRAAEEQRLRVDEALVDGLVIGHFLTRDHYRREITDLEDQLDEAASRGHLWADMAAAGDEVEDLLDHAEFDAIGGFGVEPWADDLFDDDEH